MCKRINVKKKFLIGIMVLSIAFILTGCDIPENLKAQLNSNFTNRASQNVDIAEDLYNAGVLSETTFKAVKASIESNLNDMGDKINDDEEAQKNLLKAVVGWNVIEENSHTCPYVDSKGVHCTVTMHPGGANNAAEANGEHGGGHADANDQCQSHIDGYITNYLGQQSPNLVIKTSPAFGGNGGVVQPIEVISASLAEQINMELSVPIYVLRPDITSSGGVGLDEIMEAVKKADTSNNTAEAERLLTTYFNRAVYFDENGQKQPVTIMDPDDPTQQIIRTTSRTYEEAAVEGYNPIILNYTQPAEEVALHTSSSFNNFPEDLSNQPGLDFVVYGNAQDSGTNNRMMAVRLIEFNQAAVEDLRNRIGLSENRYLVLNGKAFLMEYPVGYVSGFKETDDRLSYNAIIERSALGFNLLTGKFSKYESDENGKFTNDSVVVSDDDPYLTYLGASSSLDESQASLVLYGETGVTGQKASDGTEIDETINVPFDLYFGGREDSRWRVSIGRIVLRDYLELTYAPSIVAGEDIIALGRKMRILQLSGSKNNVVAEFYDKEGIKLSDDGARLFIDDFADIEGLIAEEQKVKYISRQQEALGAIANEIETPSDVNIGDGTVNGSANEIDTSTGVDTGEHKDPYSNSTIRASATKIDTIPTEIVSEVHMTTSFPGEYVARSDVNLSDQKPLFYGMLVRKSMFETGLFSGWVQSTDSTKNSTVWWNTWLSQHGYNYSINTDNLVDFLKGNYATDLATENIIILDLETISKIQQEYTEEDQLNNSHFLRTIFIVFGYALIAYAIILLIAWNVDINVDLGFNILEKMTLGKWVAVKDYEELPCTDEGDTRFMKFGQLLVSCILTIALGIMLIQINIINIILAVIKVFGGISSFVSELITSLYGA